MNTISRRKMTILAVMVSLAGASTSLAVGTGTFYTTCNIRYEHPLKIYSTNYHAGDLLPGGTRIEIHTCKSGKVKFRVEGQGVECMYTYVRKHSSLTFEQEFDRLFSAEDRFSPVVKDASSTVRNAISKGFVLEGMSKDQVLASYGWPPSHVTINPETDDTWKYWIKRMTTKTITFENGIVVNIQ